MRMKFEKLRIFILLVLWLSFTACSGTNTHPGITKEASRGEATMPAQAENPDSMEKTYPSCSSAKKDSAVEQYGDGLFFVPVNNTWTLYYYDPGISEAIPVCAKPQCTHDHDNCDAVYGLGNVIDGYSIQVKDGRIYLWVDMGTGKTTLYSCRQDGSDRLNLGDFVTAENSSSGNVKRSFIIGDQMIMLATVGTNKLGYTYERLFRRGLTKDSKAELLYAGEDDENIEHQLGSMIARDGKIYFTDNRFDNGFDHFSSRLIQYDCASGELKEILSLENSLIDYTVIDDAIVYSRIVYSPAYEFLPLRKLDLKTGEDMEFSSVGGNVSWDETNYYVQTQTGPDWETAEPSDIVVLDASGKELKRIDYDILMDRGTFDMCFSVKSEEDYLIANGLQYGESSAYVWHICRKEDLLADRYETHEIVFYYGSGG